MPAALGLLSGWLVGSSQSPVVSALLPLVFGFVGAAAYGLTERRLVAESAKERILAIPALSGLGVTDKTQIEQELGLRAIPPPWLPYLWMIGLLVYCPTCYVGVRLGVQQRIPAFPPMSQLVGDDVHPSEVEWPELYRAYWTMRANNVPPEQAKEVFEKSLVPILRRPVVAEAKEKMTAARSARTRAALLGSAVDRLQMKKPVPIETEQEGP
jgi:hypothetical protein